MPPAVSPKEFLQALWGDQVGVAELTTITPRRDKVKQIRSYAFFYPGAIDAFVTSSLAHSSRSLNVHMGVCLRREEWPQGGRGTEELALSTHVVWVDLDFEGFGHKGRVVKKEDARKLLAEFPLKPSMIVDSGAGIHVYWILREPAVGAEIWRAKKINRALGKYFGGDTVGDMARVLRVPDTGNFNHDTPKNSFVSYWHPDRRYLLDDFDIVPAPVDEAAPQATSEPEAPGQPRTYHLKPQQPMGNPSPAAHEPRPTPTTVLSEEAIRLTGKLFGDIWFDGWRHQMSLCVAGWMAFAGVSKECARKIVEGAATHVGGDVQQKLKNVEDTYEKFVAGGEIQGRPSLEIMIKESFPPLSKDKAIKVLDAIQKLLPRPKGSPSRGLIEPDFKILALVKYTSSPPVWTVTLEKEGQRIVTKTEHTRFMKYEVFVEDVCDQNTLVPQAALKNPQWRSMINEARRNGLYEEKQAPEELRFGGAIASGLDEFLGEAHHNPDLGILKKFPGHDDEYSFFQIETFRSFLKDRGHPFTQNQITEVLKAKGWESKVRRFGKKTPHVWIKALLKNSTDEGGNGNGHGNGNGNGHGPGPSTPQEAPTNKDLFPETSTNE